MRLGQSRAKLLSSMAGIFSLLLLSLFFILLSVTNVSAQDGGGGGPGGDPGSGGGELCKGAYYACYGDSSDRRNGWRIYDINSTGPGRFKDTSVKWSNIQKICGPYTNEIAVYVLYGGAGSWWNMGYSYITGYGSSGYIPAGTYRGGLHISLDSAYKAFQASKIDKSNLTWGKNVGWYCYGSKNSWTTSGNSYVKLGTGGTRRTSVSAKPGDTVVFDHVVRNNSDYDMNVNTVINTDHSDTATGATPTNNYSAGPDGVSRRASAKKDIYVGNNIYPYNSSNRKITQADVNKKLCQRVTWAPNAYNSNANKSSGWACVTVPYSYGLTPTIEVPVSFVTEGDATVDGITASIINSGATKSKATNYAVIRFVVRNNETAVIPSGTGVVVPASPTVPGNLITDWPCEIARHIARTNPALTIDVSVCTGKELSRVSGRVFSADSTFGIPLSSNNVSGLASSGDQICYTTLVSSYSPAIGTNTFRYAKPDCVLIGKEPKVQFWGADVRSEKDVMTGLTKINGAMYGSWAEYALFSGVKAVSSSGAGLSSSASGRPITTEPSYNRLTFSNSSLPNANFSTRKSIIPQRFMVGGVNIPSTVSLDSLEGRVYTSSGNVTITGGTVDAGERIIIRARGTVTISGNLQYRPGTYSNSSDVPQLVIIAKNIVINSGVSEVNAWLIAQESTPATGRDGYVSTCGAVSQPSQFINGLSSSACNGELRINGAVISDRLYLRRTFGGERANPGQPAEILNLRSDTYLSFFGEARNSGAISTKYIRELSPRL